MWFAAFLCPIVWWLQRNMYFCRRETKCLFMNTQAMTQTIAEYFKTKPVLKAWLFGSYSRGEETPDSDVDILVSYDEKANVSLFTIGGMYMDLRRLTGKNIDLIEEGTLEPYAEESVNRDKKLFYERTNQG